jgi:hypothetical protein
VVPGDAAQARPTTAKAKGQAAVALDLLRNAIAEAGEVPPTSNHIPANTRTISVETWRRYFYAGTVAETPSQDARQKAFVRAVVGLQRLQLIGKWDDHVWLT